MTPAASVIIPSSRGGKYLREAVNSARTPDVDWEIIVVADGSTEDMSDLEADERVRVIRQRNRGASIARNVGVANARAELIAFLDDDDRMLPGRLVEQCRAMGQNPDAGLCHTQIRIIDAEGNPVSEGNSRDVQYREFLRIEGGIVFSSIMVRKSVFQEVGGFSSVLPMGEDLDFIYKVAREYKLVFIPETLTEYRLHANNSWAGSAESSSEEIKIMLAQHRMASEAKGQTVFVEDVRKGLQHVLPGRSQIALSHARKALAERQPLTFMRSVGSLLRHSPIAGTRVAVRKARGGTGSL
jgi:glycosyltransferase involved in cell wall biosynthesis